MLAQLFNSNVHVSLAFGFVFCFLFFHDYYITKIGFDGTNDNNLEASRAVSFLWGAGIQPGLAYTQYVIATQSNPTQLVAYGKVHAFWWTTFGILFVMRIPNVTSNLIAMFTPIFTITYGLIYGYYSFIDVVDATTPTTKKKSI